MGFRGSLKLARKWLAGSALVVLCTTSAASAQRMTDEEFQQTTTKLSDASPETRVAAIDTIGRSGWRFRREASPRLRQILREDTDWHVRASAGRAIGRLGLREAVPDLVHALRDTQVEVRVVAAAALWRVPDAAAVPALIEVLADTDAAARQWAAVALGVTHDTRATQPLIRLLGDAQDSVQLDAIRSLGRIGDPAALPALVYYVNDERKTMEARLEAVNSVASLQGPTKTNALVRLLETRNMELRLQCVRALGEIGDALVVPRLRQLSASPGSSEVGRAIQDAIRAIDARMHQTPAPTATPTSTMAPSTTPTSAMAPSTTPAPSMAPSTTSTPSTTSMSR